MKILAIDTSTKACVLGLMVDGDLHSDEEVIDRTHSKEILPRIEGLLLRCSLRARDLDLIVYGQGPGSFTGLRIGIGVTQGLAFGLDIPVVGVSTLACFAQQSYRLYGAINSLVVLVARKEEVYFGAYNISSDIARLKGTEGVLEAGLIPRQDPNLEWTGTGTGWHLQPQLESAAGVKVSEVHVSHYPEACDLIRLGLDQFEAGKGLAAIDARPKYLREVVASVPKNSP